MINGKSNVFANKINESIGQIQTLKTLKSEELTESLLIHYFSNGRKTSEYKYIPKDLLSNKLFVYSVIQENPDIYPLIDNKFKKEVFEIFKHEVRDFLKYGDEEERSDVKNIEIAMKYNESNIFYIHPSKVSEKNVASFLKKNDFHNILDSKTLNKLFSFLRDDLKTEDKFSFYFMYGSYKCVECAPENLRNSVNLAKKILTEDPPAIAGMSKNLLNNDEFVTSLINIAINEQENRKNNSYYYHQSFEYKFLNKNNGLSTGINQLLINIDEKYLTKEVCNALCKNIRDIYLDLDKKKQNNTTIIKSLFAKDKEIEHRTDVYRVLPKEFKELKDLIKEYVKQEVKKNRWIEDSYLNENIRNIVDYYFLTKDYDLDNTNQNKKVRNKI